MVLTRNEIDAQHYCLRALLGDALFLAPLSRTRALKVLDLGTGTGIWAKELARELPSTKVVGVDLSEVEDVEDKPTPCTFVIGDYETDWSNFTTSKFDYIHGRMLLCATRDAAKLVLRATEHLNPGGWFEWQELVFEVSCSGQGVEDIKKCDHQTFNQWGYMMIHSAKSVGIDMMLGKKLIPHFESAGLTNVHAVRKNYPMGPWKSGSERPGALIQRHWLTGIQNICMHLFTTGLGMTKKDVDDMLVKVKEEIADPDVHHSLQFYVYYGQKPSET